MSPWRRWVSRRESVVPPRPSAEVRQEELIAEVADDLLRRLDAIVKSVPLDFGGGSGQLKALTSAALILRHGLTSYLEIGVYRGRSLLPVAAVFDYLGRGTAVGIDPWNVAAATQQDLHLFPPAAATVNGFVAGLDWDGMYAEVLERIDDHGLQDHCSLVRARASDVTATFADRSVGILHVDGNHDEAAVLDDLANFLPKVVPGGFVILDDVSWRSVRAARSLLDRDHRLLFVDAANDFAVFAVD
jgi:predicted O-methyltransferase YrrM